MLEIRNAVREALGPKSRWTVTAEQHDGFELVAVHPASAGMVLVLAGVESAQVALTHVRRWLDDPEFRIADAAPLLTHPDVAMDVRGIAKAYDWSNDEVRAVALLLDAVAAISTDEAGWLAGWVGSGAPERATPPAPEAAP